MSIDLIGTLLSTVLGARPRRRSRNALGFLTGRHLGGRGLAGGLLNANTIVTAAGVAWGIYETIQQRTAAGATTGASAPPPVPPAPARAATGVTAPLGVAVPGGAAAMPTGEATDPRTLRLLRVALAAANADGLMTDEERAALDGQVSAAGVPQPLLQQLGARVPLADVVAGVDDPAERTALYVIAFTIARADEQVSGAERIFLARLASLLSLDPSAVETIERETAAQIDAAGGDVTGDAAGRETDGR